MKMLLTSHGLRNATLASALADMVAKPFAEVAVVVILDAAVAVAGNKSWLFEHLDRLRELGWQEIDVIDVGSVPKGEVQARLRSADVVYVEGGDPYHLATTIVSRDLVQLFDELIHKKVYLGISAGAMIFSQHFGERAGALFGDHEAEGVKPPFGFFDWYLEPHWNSPRFPGCDDAWAERIAAMADFPIYLLEDESALRVEGELGAEGVEVVGEGRGRFIPGREN